jgi:hypothetical protein
MGEKIGGCDAISASITPCGIVGCRWLGDFRVLKMALLPTLDVGLR